MPRLRNDMTGPHSIFSRITLPLAVIIMAAASLTTDIAGQRHRDMVRDLPEVTVKSNKNSVLHLLAYVREYSTLSSYTDTVFLFREKLVDFMLPSDPRLRYKGWSVPRVIKSKSYYRFTDHYGLDSVSDESAYHFSWSDWLGTPPAGRLPSALRKPAVATDTVMGKYNPSEIWIRDNDKVSLHVNVLSDTVARKWVPDLNIFFRRNTDFETCRVTFNYENVLSGTLSPADLTHYSFCIDSKERGHSMFRFNRPGDPYFVTTTAGVHILDREYISVKEAKKWERHDFRNDDLDIIRPMEMPPPEPEILALMERVDKIDKGGVRLSLTPDHWLGSIDGTNKNYQFGNRLLLMLKQITGIGIIKGKRNVEKRWKNFKKEWRQRHPPVVITDSTSRDKPAGRVDTSSTSR